MTEEEHQAQLHALVNTARNHNNQDTTARIQNPYGNIAASAQVLPMSVLPPPTTPPEIIPAVLAKEGVRVEGLPNSIDPTKPPRNWMHDPEVMQQCGWRHTSRNTRA